jgi:putative DNA primase/helicase
MPSYKAMMDFASGCDKVKILLLSEKQAQAGEDFASPDEDGDDDWKAKLQYQSRSTVLQNSVWNEMLILNNDPDCQGFAYNEMANRIQVTGDVPWDRPADNKFWRDADTAQLKALIDIRYVCFSDRNHNVSFTKGGRRPPVPSREELLKRPAGMGSGASRGRALYPLPAGR